MTPRGDTAGAWASREPYNLQLADRRCMVTGASSGIGRAIALSLASAGATVCAVGRRCDQLNATVERSENPGRITTHVADLSVERQIAMLVDEIRGGVDVLVHSAGAFSSGPLGTAPIEDLDRQYVTNVRAPYLLTKALLPTLRANRGQIVFINSTLVFAPRPNVGQFAATQHALRAIADALREEINADGVRVVSVYPGRTATTRQARIHALEGKPYFPDRLLQPEDVADVVLNVLTLPRSAEVTDVRVRPMLKH
jgi:NADP-dependent 3-hydroxy acid dehydrogenase YdfG